MAVGTSRWVVHPAAGPLMLTPHDPVARRPAGVMCMLPSRIASLMPVGPMLMTLPDLHAVHRCPFRKPRIVMQDAGSCTEQRILNGSTMLPSGTTGRAFPLPRRGMGRLAAGSWVPGPRPQDLVLCQPLLRPKGQEGQWGRRGRARATGS